MHGFLKIRNSYVLDANSRLLPIPNDTKAIKDWLKQRISKTSSKDDIGAANSKVGKTADPIWKSSQLDEQMHKKDLSGRYKITKDN